MLRLGLALVLVTLLPCSTFALSQHAQSTVASSKKQPQPSLADRLSKIRRIYIESFGDDPISRQMKALLIDAITSSNRFIVTENKQRADAILKGVGTEQSSHELHSTHDGTLVGNFAGVGGISDSSTSTETLRQAHLTIRLVSSDGDVLWSTEKESTGGKFKGPAADVADQAVKQLLSDLEHAGG